MMTEYMKVQGGPRKVARLLFCTCPCYSINFWIYAMLWTWVHSIA